MMKKISATSLRKALLVLAILLLSATDLLAQGNFGLGSSDPGEIGLFSPGNNDTLASTENVSSAFPGLIVDWIGKGAVTRVKDQTLGGQVSCDSSWAFSTTGVLEGWAKIRTGHLPSLSEQELVDCAGSAGAQGCNGGDPEAGLVYAMQKGLCLESAYPYTGRVGKCKRCLSPHDKPTRIYRILKNDESMLLEQVKRQPVAVALDLGAFSSYKGGVVAGTCGKALDTAALIVGFGQDGPNLYWLVKNSLGPNWGEDGYIRIVYGKNECGIAEAAVVPALE